VSIDHGVTASLFSILAPAAAASGHPSAPRPGLRAHVADIYEQSSEWISAYWLQITIAAATAVAIYLLLNLVRGWAMKLCRRGSGISNWYGIIARAIGKTGQVFMMLAAARLVIGYAAAPPWLVATVGTLLTISAVFQAAVWLREIVFGVIENRTTEEHHGQALASALGIIRLLVTIALFAIALVVVLGNLGVNVTGLVAGLGVGGIAIGLAAQGIFADLFAALAIIFDRPFSKGDQISYGTSSGTIEAIGLKSTRIRAYTGELRVISNKALLDKELLNVTKRDHIRMPFTIGVAYETPPETLARVPAILKELVEAEGAKAARAGFETFGASSLDFTLLVDVPGADWSVAHPLRDRLLVAIMKRFAAEGISIPYPTQTTFTAAPDGKLIMPYLDGASTLPVERD
jgi:small-conductance mechanosensitive channel